MRARVQKWGNSLAVRIPKTYASEMGLADESLVDVTVVEGKLIISPVREVEFRLDELLAQVTDENIHGEVDTGPAVGREVW